MREQKLTLHCVKSVRIRSISPYSVRMRKNAGKMRTRITPNTDTFYAVVVDNKEISHRL